MKNFTCIADVPRPVALLEEAMSIKANPLQYEHFGKHHTLIQEFFNPSLRTRISTEKAALNLGMQVISMNASQGWNIEFEDNVVMDADRAEHIRAAAAVISPYASIIGVRTFPNLTEREADYADSVLKKFVQFARVPVVSLESAKRHPLQSLADWMTIEEHKRVKRPKVVLTWAPHPKALPQAVANSFLEWMKHAGVELVVTHPPGYELAEEFSAGITSEPDQDKALEGADFVYTKNWSAYHDYGKVLHRDPSWMITPEKMQLTNKGKFMHCLPVRRNMVVADTVLDSEASLVLHQAHNRTFAAQAVLKQLLEKIADDSGDYRFARSHLFD